MQSRLHSLIETLADVAVGLAINVALNWILLPLVLNIPHPTAHQNFVLTAIFTVVALARRYVMRRVFNRWHRHAIAFSFALNMNQKGILK
jgi:putative flippase GtrA